MFERLLSSFARPVPVAPEQQRAFEQEHAVIPSIAGLPRIIRAFVRPSRYPSYFMD